jgi:hypothetical protein
MHTPFMLIVIASSFLSTPAFPAAQPKPSDNEAAKKGLAFIKRAPDLSLKAYQDNLDTVFKNPQKSSATIAYIALKQCCIQSLCDLWKHHDTQAIKNDTSKSFTPGIHGPEIVRRLPQLPKQCKDAFCNELLNALRPVVNNKKECPELPFSPEFTLLNFDIIEIMQCSKKTFKGFVQTAVGKALTKEQYEKLIDDMHGKNTSDIASSSARFCSTFAGFLKDSRGIGRIRYLQLLYYYNTQKKAVLQKTIEAFKAKKSSAFSNAGAALKGFQSLLKQVDDYLAAADKAIADAEQNLKGAAEKSQSESTATAAASAQDTATAAAKK